MKRTVVRRTYAIPIRLQVHPSQLGRMKGRDAGNIFRPRRQLIAGGMPYVTPRATTDAETMALKALLDPRKIQPKMMTRIVVNQSALSGTWSRLLTFEKIRLAGKPPSLAKAYTILLLVVMMLTPANSKQTRGNTRRQTDPALFDVAS